MATIQIRDVPDDVYETIRRRAKADGRSIQAYMLALLTDQARRRTRGEALTEFDATMAGSASPGLAVSGILDALDEVRR